MISNRNKAVGITECIQNATEDHPILKRQGGLKLNYYCPQPVSVQACDQDRVTGLSPTDLEPRNNRIMANFNDACP